MNEKPNLKEMLSLKEGLNSKLEQQRNIWNGVVNQLEQNEEKSAYVLQEIAAIKEIINNEEITKKYAVHRVQQQIDDFIINSTNNYIVNPDENSRDLIVYLAERYDLDGIDLNNLPTVGEVRRVLYETAGLEYIPTNQVLQKASQIHTSEDKLAFDDLEQRANVTYANGELTYQAPYKDPIQQVQDYKNAKSHAIDNNELSEMLNDNNQVETTVNKTM